MEIIVVKFGGTSVADEHARANAIERIKELRALGYGVAAVVSAMGRRGAPYATDTLLSLVRGTDASSPLTRDLLMCCGEQISACVFADALEAAGVRAVPMNGLTAGVKTDGVYNSAEVTDIDATRVLAALEAGLVPVVTGFQGVSDKFEFNTLGRGGSDTSAAELGGYLKAKAVYIYTDVDGVYTADPRKDPSATLIPRISCADMLDMAEHGATVIHPRAVRAAMKHGVPLWVKSTFKRDGGTEIN